MDDWLADFIAQERLPADFVALADDLWRPIAEETATAARAHGRGFVLGICGSQGSGKSTACAVLQRLLEARGLKTAVVSLDDLYLTHEARQGLAREIHPLLATRGVPGTHDVDLGLRTLDGLARSGETALPRFDKARDTRAPETDWPRVQGPADVILFEGWCVGARPQETAALAEPVNGLERDSDPDGLWRRYVNERLAGSYQALFARIGRLLLLAAPGFEAVLGWRQEQEDKLRERLAREGGGGRAMTAAEVETFVQHYERLTRHILSEMPARADRVVRLDAARRPLGH